MTKLKTINMSGISIDFSNCFAQSTTFNNLTYANFTNCEFYGSVSSVSMDNHKLGFNKANVIVDVAINPYMVAIALILSVIFMFLTLVRYNKKELV